MGQAATATVAGSAATEAATEAAGAAAPGGSVVVMPARAAHEDPAEDGAGQATAEGVATTRTAGDPTGTPTVHIGLCGAARMLGETVRLLCLGQQRPVPLPGCGPVCRWRPRAGVPR